VARLIPEPAYPATATSTRTVIIEPAASREAETRYLQRYHVLSEAAGYTPTPAAFDTE